MPGMTGAPSLAHLTLAQAFRAALLGQTVYAMAIFVALAIAWVACRELLPLRVKVSLPARRAAAAPEPAGRRLLRIGFGALWVLDAILQGQPAMPSGLPARVLIPAAAGSPGWVQSLVHWAAASWSGHPVQSAAAAVWVQLGIGVWLLGSATGRSTRLAGLAGAVWALLIWAFGEAFGGLLAPGASVLTGAPGAALFYVAAGALLALPERCWHDAALGRRTLQLTGGVLACLVILQAWPHQFWQGRIHGQLGPLAAMAQSMAANPQPAPLARVVSGFGALAASHGFAVNLVVVVILGGIAAGLLTGRRAVVGPAVAAAVAFFLADWVLVQDLGFLGGTGTDPNSMIPLALLVLAGFVAMTRPAVPSAGPRVPALAAGTSRETAVHGPSLLAGNDAPPLALSAAAAASTVVAAPSAGDGTRADGRGTRLRIAFGAADAGVVVACWGGALLAFGAVLMALAEAHGAA